MREGRIAEDVLGKDLVHVRTEPSLGSEDFAYFTAAVPGTMGAGTGHPQLLHNEYFCPDESCLKNGILLEVVGALTFLEDIAHSIKQNNMEACK